MLALTLALTLTLTFTPILTYAGCPGEEYSAFFEARMAAFRLKEDQFIPGSQLEKAGIEESIIT